LEDKKGEDILLLDLRELGLFSEYFVICSGTSDRTLKGLLDGALDAARTQHKAKPKLEGRPEEGWLLADFGSVDLHVFSNDQREYYRLEDLWSQGKVLLHMQ
jgi:ribosome-associated protein